jgi:hypothetical protein
MRWNNRVGDRQLIRGVRKGQAVIEPNDPSLPMVDLGAVVIVRFEVSVGD